MKLFEIHQRPVFAWLEPTVGPGGVVGVALKYIRSTDTHLHNLINNAKELLDKRDDDIQLGRIAQLTKQLNQNHKEHRTYDTPSLGWWRDEKDFHQGKEGAKGTHKGDLLHRYPNLSIVKSKDQAVKYSKEHGII
jgi:hypothetical protein